MAIRSVTVATLPRGTATPIAVALIAVAWLAAIVAELSGKAVLLHHHTLIEGGPPLPAALFLFLLGWQVMVAAMMLPASLPAVRRLDRVRSTAQSTDRPGFGPAFRFLLGYAAVWSIYGAGAFVFDVGLHRLTDAIPFLAARPWLIESTAVLAAAVYQFVPAKRRALEGCRHPFESHAHGAGPGGALALGARHGYDCVVSSWALMLLMFSAGFANVWWMLALAALMALETFGRPAAAIIRSIGLLLFGFAGLILFFGWIPAFAG